MDLSPIATSSEPKASPKLSRIHMHRLSKEGTKILTDAFESGLQNPTEDQKKLLLYKIKAFPHCDHYQMKNLNNWFSKKRSKSISRITDSQGPRKHYPTLKRGNIKQLITLFAETPYPSKEVISVWASLLRSSKEDIEAWIADQQQTHISTDGQQSSSSPFIPLSPLSIISHSRLPSPTQEEGGEEEEEEEEEEDDYDLQQRPTSSARSMSVSYEPEALKPFTVPDRSSSLSNAWDAPQIERDCVHRLESGGDDRYVAREEVSASRDLQNPVDTVSTTDTTNQVVGQVSFPASQLSFLWAPSMKHLLS
ncbi:hypothetical protein BDP27DRAFT_621804 [Rhodocollybia butyracea]|uniref:Homeobox domain-containing protein n=1 Tax=Rhodocollybia butyracea TaxID=206335 RepID=A0A9P5U8U2_9AGAR|nr:hypothetical protein BDP27DRAFT_621804 [Rhodocollybia butyracea]